MQEGRPRAPLMASRKEGKRPTRGIIRHCPDCDHVSDSSDDWVAHRLTHGDERPFPCPHCDYRAYSKANVDAHIQNIHVKKFRCHHIGCYYGTGYKSSLDAHLNLIHCPAGERPFPCDQEGCRYRAKNKSHLTAHKRRTHLRIRDHKCHICGKKSFGKDHMRSHMMSCHHNDVHDMNECKECAYLQKDARRSEIMKRVRRRPNSPVPSDEETELEEDAELGDEIENPASESLNDFLINIHQKMLLLRGS